MTTSRIEALLTELQARHGNRDPQFLAAVRPMVARILEPATPPAARVPLLELLAETFERDQQVRRDLAVAREQWQRFFAQLRDLLGGG
jgi:hypothetical protein